MYKNYIFIFLIIAIVTLTGCWDYRDIEDMAVVSGVAIDYDEKSEGIILTVEIVIPSSKQNQTSIESDIIQGIGVNHFDAARNLISKVGNKLYWGYAEVIILSNEVIQRKDLFIGILDWFRRDAETRSDIWVVLSREKTAAEILLKSDTKIQDVKSFYINDILKNEKSVSKYRAVELWRFIDEIGAKGICATLPTVELIPERSTKGDSKKIPDLNGCTVLNINKAVGWLNGNETKMLLLLKDKLKGGLIVIEEESVKTTLELFKSKTKIIPKIIADEIIMQISIELTVNLAEIQGQIDYIEEDKRKELQIKAEKEVTASVVNLIKKLQEEYKCDAIGFGNIMEVEEPRVWKQIEDKWEDVFKTVDCDIKVKINIRGSALRSEPIKVKE